MYMMYVFLNFNDIIDVWLCGLYAQDMDQLMLNNEIMNFGKRKIKLTDFKIFYKT